MRTGDAGPALYTGYKGVLIIKSGYHMPELFHSVFKSFFNDTGRIPATSASFHCPRTAGVKSGGICPEDARTEKLP